MPGKRAVFTCAPKKLDTFSSFRLGQTVTKLCLPHNSTRQPESSQSKVPANCKCHAKRAVFTCAPKKLDAFSSFRPGQTVTKYCACHTIRVSLKVANRKSQRTVNAMQNEPCSLAHLKNQTLSVPPAQVKPSQSIAP